jgi:outer membrane protein OmpA-like peptidoglycan-associated protein
MKTISLTLTMTALLITGCSSTDSQTSSAITETRPVETQQPEPVKVSKPVQSPTSKIQFAFDSTEISSMEAEKLAEWIDYLNKVNAQEIALHGHADEVGSENYNFDLSKRRAKAVEAKLNELLNNPITINLHAYGETRPIVNSSSELMQRKNRRVEIELLSADPTKQSAEVTDSSSNR